MIGSFGLISKLHGDSGIDIPELSAISNIILRTAGESKFVTIAGNDEWPCPDPTFTSFTLPSSSAANHALNSSASSFVSLLTTPPAPFPSSLPLPVPSLLLLLASVAPYASTILLAFSLSILTSSLPLYVPKLVITCSMDSPPQYFATTCTSKISPSAPRLRPVSLRTRQTMSARPG
ncbi:hypothetical protein AYI69_g5291 [Smittium culicis]|uniref:Uncharacterized protein n=1 Tax=Smittium culicis TaxID=133412 RepID=A0A1R1Y770_9FUNG|nr:hypothetical protein AYI69_g5291 [Smittium culicis]